MWREQQRKRVHSQMNLLQFPEKLSSFSSFVFVLWLPSLYYSARCSRNYFSVPHEQNIIEKPQYSHGAWGWNKYTSMFQVNEIFWVFLVIWQPTNILRWQPKLSLSRFFFQKSQFFISLLRNEENENVYFYLKINLFLLRIYLFS